MASDQPSPKKKSTTPKTADKMPKRPAGSEAGPARAHRTDTPEAKQQQAGTPKTHAPHRTSVSARKDNNA